MNSTIALVPRLSDAGTYVDATKLSTVEYMYVRSMNKRAAFMGTTFTRAPTGESPRFALAAAVGGFLNLVVCFRYRL